MPKIRALEIKGFRAYGKEVQRFEFNGLITLFYAPNSQGKTSLAEAIEFLLTGKTIRREMIASAKREFSEALRNAHLSVDEDVLVAAEIEDASGDVYRIDRRLIRDYSSRGSCESELKINDNTTSDLTAIGVQLSEPPLEAPVLLPHTLRFVISASPQGRADYFKALLEVSDLEAIRNALFEAKKRIAEPDGGDAVSLYMRCSSHSDYGTEIELLKSRAPTRSTVEEILSNALTLILAGHGEAPGGFDTLLDAAKKILEQQRATEFPINQLQAREQPSWGIRREVQSVLEAYLKAKKAIDEEVARLLRLFEEVLKIPGLSSTEEAIDCPVCETPTALTPERIRSIREKVKANAQYAKHRNEAEQLLSDLHNAASAAIMQAEAALPQAMKWQEEERSLYQKTISELPTDRADSLLSPWSAALSRLQQAQENLQHEAGALQELLGDIELDNLDEGSIKEIYKKVTQTSEAFERLIRTIEGYREVAGPLLGALRQEVDHRAGMEGWQDLIDLCEKREDLLTWLIETTAYRETQNEIEKAIQEIDLAKAQVLDDKFYELSGEILRWWNLLRPDEPTSFHSVQRGGTGRRYVDLKAALGSESVFRDAVAVFSDSQLNALGLAAFLARTVREEVGFVVLDDPVPATDKEHRAYFVNMVIGNWLKVVFK